MTAIDKLKDVSAFLKSKDIEDAHKESEIIVIHSLKVDKAALYRDNPILSEKNIKEIDDILERRAKREPLQYILGYVEFYELKIKVGEGVLIPRPETELMVEEVLKQFQVPSSKSQVLDLCTGSGCLALAIAKHFPDAKVYGTDISKRAIRYANENAEINNIRNVTFIKGSLFEPVYQFAPFDVIVSNPPYVRSDDIAHLQPEVKDWEPRNALDGGEDGLRYYKEILSGAKRYLKPCGLIFLEIGEGLADAVIMLSVRSGFRDICVVKDYAGIERIISMTS